MKKLQINSVAPNTPIGIMGNPQQSIETYLNIQTQNNTNTQNTWKPEFNLDHFTHALIELEKEGQLPAQKRKAQIKELIEECDIYEARTGGQSIGQELVDVVEDINTDRIEPMYLWKNH
jgi:hypothetical protein